LAHPADALSATAVVSGAFARRSPYIRDDSVRASFFRPALLALSLSCVSAPLANAAEKQEVQGDHGQNADHDELTLSPAQIDHAGVTLLTAGAGAIAEQITASGLVIADQDRIARVPAKVLGAVAELRKRLGDEVAKGEVVAVLDSRETADAQSELLAALVHYELQKTLFERTQTLWTKKITTEQAFLQARSTAAAAELRVNLARQKLAALGVSPLEIAALKPNGSSAELGRYPIRAPIAGRVIERKVDLGASVGGNNDPSELYTIADLGHVWVELSIPSSELGRIREGQKVTVRGADDLELAGRIIFISPLLNPDTRTARVLAAFDNPDLALRPGAFVSAFIALKEIPVAVRAPRSAFQTEVDPGFGTIR
jgi:cobalt-zinc-cadmium efflux system membrane fusion protein